MIIFSCLLELELEMETANWLRKKIEKAGITQAELARRSGISPTHITKVLNGERGLGEQSLLAIAKALHIPPENIYREAGLLPPVPKADEQQEELIYLFNQLPDQEKRSLLRFIRATLDAIKREN